MSQTSMDHWHVRMIDLETRAQTRPKGQKAARPGLALATLESVFWDRGTT